MLNRKQLVVENACVNETCCKSAFSAQAKKCQVRTSPNIALLCLLPISVQLFNDLPYN